ncbi:hypothetical protein ABIB56_002991 [Glaciihabitans sp. UYNi722]
MTDLKNDSASRWAAAAQLADGVTDDRYQKRRTRILLQVGALIVGSWIVGVVTSEAPTSSPQTCEAATCRVWTFSAGQVPGGGVAVFPSVGGFRH